MTKRNATEYRKIILSNSSKFKYRRCILPFRAGKTFVANNNVSLYLKDTSNSLKMIADGCIL